MSTPAFAEGRCTCGAIRYRMATKPLFIHACHCSYCQRETAARSSRRLGAEPPIGLRRTAPGW